jgi:methyl-accepting chemotaxis protein
MKFQNFNLKSKMLVVFISSMVVLTVLTMMTSSLMTKRAIKENLTPLHKVFTGVAGSAVVGGLQLGDKQEVGAEMAGFTTQEIFSYIRVVNKSGEEVFSYRKNGWPEIKGEDLGLYEDGGKEVFQVLPVESHGQKYGTITVGLSMEKCAESINTVRSVLIVLGILDVLIFTVITFVITKYITEPLAKLSSVAERIAQGDLTQTISNHSGDEIGQLFHSFAKMVESLRSIVGQFGESAAAVASASSQISSSTEEMASGAQEQTTQAGEVAASVEQMARTIVENSKSAKQTTETAQQAMSAAAVGGHVVEETVEGMKAIAQVVNKTAITVKALGKSSDQIGEIIGVIDDIADQTNLLALNAAIEAARAGEQGRGFAVVADEVRKLAERTTKATKEIAVMIKHIQTETAGAVDSMEEGTKKVNEGILLADKAGTSLKQIVEVSQKVTTMVGQIASASEQQSNASEQISKNVESITSITSETASGIQQIARAAEDLNELTESLQRLVSTFVLVSGPENGSTPQYKQEKSKIVVQKNGSLILHA